MTGEARRLKQSKLRRVLGAMVEIFLRTNLLRAAAGLSYFLTLSVFPMLICLYHMLGGLFPATEELRSFLTGVLPDAATDAILDYLGYVSNNTGTAMLVAALAVMLTSSSAAYRTIDKVMGEMRGGSMRFSGFFEILFSMAFSLVFLAAIYFAAILVVTGKWFLEFMDRHIMSFNISDAWSWGRFVLLFLVLFLLLSGVYRLTAPRGRPVRLLPGAVAASVALLIVGIVFSMFIGRSVRYPLVYGSLASVILMMFWLYVCGVVLFLGNALNVALENS